MRALLPASILSAAILTYVLYQRRESSAFVLATLAVSLMLAALAITLVVNVPLDCEFVSWTVDTLPGDWRATRNRWELFHGMRTLLSIAALACLVGSVLVSRNRPGIARIVNRAAA